MITEKKTPKTRRQCGTVAGYGQHQRHGEIACEDCKAANREYHRRRRAGDVPPRTPGREKRLKAAEEAGGVIAEAVNAAVDGGRRFDDPYPPFLKGAGRKLWDDITGEFDLGPAALVVLTEACRMADRLERFSAALSVQSALWFELGEPEINEHGDPQTQVVVNAMISEARQMTAGIRQALASIGVLQAGKKKGGEGGMLDQVAKKRQERLAKAREAAK